jgi:hypothetical protein
MADQIRALCVGDSRERIVRLIPGTRAHERDRAPRRRSHTMRTTPRSPIDRALGGVDPSEAVVRGGTSSYVIPAAHLCEAHNSAAVADHVPLVDAPPQPARCRALA